MRFSQLELFNVCCGGCVLLITEMVIIVEGSVYTVRILSRSDLDRQIVRSPTCDIVIPEYELSLPATARGRLTTVEGLIRDVVSDLSIDQPLRRRQNEGGYAKIQTLIDKLSEILNDDEGAPFKITAHKDNESFPAFTIQLDDPAGNSWIEFVGSMADPKWNMTTYPRTHQHNVALGLVAAGDQQKQASSAELASNGREVSRLDTVTPDEVLVFPGYCPSCGHPLDTLMKKVNIPYFKVSHSVSFSPIIRSIFGWIGYPDHVHKLRAMWIP